MKPIRPFFQGMRNGTIKVIRDNHALDCLEWGTEDHVFSEVNRVVGRMARECINQEIGSVLRR